MIRNLAAALCAALLAACLAATPAEAASRSTHCGITTTWRYVGSDEDVTTRIRLYRKPSSAGRIAWCAEAFDLNRQPQSVILLLSTNQRNYGSKVGGNKASWLVRTPDSIDSLYAEAGVIGHYVVFTGWWKP